MHQLKVGHDRYSILRHVKYLVRVIGETGGFGGGAVASQIHGDYSVRLG